MARNVPGKNYRQGISMLGMALMLPAEQAATEWTCPRCGSMNTHEVGHPKMTYRCRDCRQYLSVETGRHNFRELDTFDQMRLLAKGLEGKRLRFKDLIAESSAAA